MDCPGLPTATATLELNSGYVPGTALNAGDLISFNYDGTNVLPAFSINLGDTLMDMSGVFPSSISGPTRFHIEGRGAFDPSSIPGLSTAQDTPRFTFDTYPDGSWFALDANLTICSSVSCDQGTGATWATTAVPEPGVFFLVAGGLAALGLRRWKLKA